MGASKNPHFIPTDGTTDETTDETPNYSTGLSKNDNPVAGYAALRKKFLAYISNVGKQKNPIGRITFPSNNFDLASLNSSRRNDQWMTTSTGSALTRLRKTTTIFCSRDYSLLNSLPDTQ